MNDDATLPWSEALPPVPCSPHPEVSALAAKIDPSVLEHDAYAAMTNLAISLERRMNEARAVAEELAGRINRAASELASSTTLIIVPWITAEND